MTDRHLFFAAAFLRALATGMMAVLLTLYLSRLEYDAAGIGFITGIGLAGMAAGSLLVTLVADRIGRRRMLYILAVLSGSGGVLLVQASSWWAIAAAAFIGMINGMGRDRGGTLALEQAMLPAACGDADRTHAFAWYNVLQSAGHACGGLLAGLPALLERAGMSSTGAVRWTILLYAVLLVATLLPYSLLSGSVDAVVDGGVQRLTARTRAILWRISLLFALDSTAGGFIAGSLMSYFFFEKFGASPIAVGMLFFGSRIANAVSHLGAAWLARRIGLVNTMVFTHIPSSLLLVTVPFAPDFTIAAALFLLREGLVEMDVPTRQSYVMAVVHPEERTRASGITNLVRMAGWALGPFIAGPLMEGVSVALPLFIGAGIKIAYDLLLYVAFREIKPPEELR